MEERKRSGQTGIKYSTTADTGEKEKRGGSETAGAYSLLKIQDTR